MAQHDSAYKLIFSHPEMVRDLLQGFVPEEWVKHLDFSTLDKVNSDYISEDLINRADDIVWRLRLKDSDEWIYIYVLLEFQSRNDRWMALRLMTYIGLLYQELVRGKNFAAGKRLPPVFPVVIYNGDARWTAPLEVADLIQATSGTLTAYQPRLRYFLLDEKRYKQTDLPPADNLVTSLVGLENSQEVSEVQLILNNLIRSLKDPEHDDLRKAFTTWVMRIIINKIKPAGDTLPDTLTLEEINTMLAERVEQWTENWKRQGLEQGREQGLEQGLQKGQILMLTHLLEHRFGSLLPVHTDQLQAASQDQIEAWSKAVFTAQSLDEFFATH